MIMIDKKSPNKENNQLGRELPHSHLYQGLLPIIFIIIWTIDTFFLSLTTWLNLFIHPLIRFILFIGIFCIGIFFIQLAHKTIFKDNEPSETLLVEGILLHVRNPMYLGILLFYISILFLSLSVISIIFFIFIFFIYNIMVNYEENVLEKKFGKEYVDYKIKVPKWVPSIKKRL